MRLPRLLLPISAGALIGALLPGYLGLALELAGFASLICLMALGYAAAHHATIGIGARGFALTALWLATLLFGLPAILMLFAGIAEIALGWRDRVLASRYP